MVFSLSLFVILFVSFLVLYFLRAFVVSPNWKILDYIVEVIIVIPLCFLNSNYFSLSVYYSPFSLSFIFRIDIYTELINSFKSFYVSPQVPVRQWMVLLILQCHMIVGKKMERHPREKAERSHWIKISYCKNGRSCCMFFSRYLLRGILAMICFVLCYLLFHRKKNYDYAFVQLLIFSLPIEIFLRDAKPFNITLVIILYSYIFLRQVISGLQIVRSFLSYRVLPVS